MHEIKSANRTKSQSTLPTMEELLGHLRTLKAGSYQKVRDFSGVGFQFTLALSQNFMGVWRLALTHRELSGTNMDFAMCSSIVSMPVLARLWHGYLKALWPLLPTTAPSNSKLRF